MSGMPDVSPRLLFFHKQGASARTRFLRFAHGMLGFAELPAGSSLRDVDGPPPTVLPHPAALLNDAAKRLGLPESSLRAETEFQAVVDTPADEIPVLLVEFTTLDPPFAAAEQAGARFIAITEARDRGELELALMRRAYEILIG
jgi:hypothetical protein